MRRKKTICVILIIILTIAFLAILNSVTLNKNARKWGQIQDTVETSFGLNNNYIEEDGIKVFHTIEGDVKYTIFGTNDDQKYAELQFAYNANVVCVVRYIDYYTVRLDNDECNNLHCTINLELKPYDTRHFIFWTSGSNDTFYKRIDSIVDFNTINDNINRLNEIAEGLITNNTTAILGGCNVEGAVLPVSNEAKVIESIRNGMREHSRRINIRFTSSEFFNASDLTEWGLTLVEAALTETENPREGDYIRYQNGGYKVSVASDDSEYTVSIEPKYYLYHYQEEQASKVAEEAIEDIFSEENWENLSEYERTYAVYDYICRTIKYDKVHEGNPEHTLRSTIYAGLIWKSATCQGYCVTLYRLLREVGIDCRILTGTASDGEDSGKHAWMMISIGGKYYYADPTWDSERIGNTINEGEDLEYQYFLLGSNNFPNHTLDAAFDNGAFREEYLMSEDDYNGK